jgi:hypothetical protein
MQTWHMSVVNLNSRRAERELTELIEKSRAAYRAFWKLRDQVGMAELEAMGFDWADVEALAVIEQAARRGLEKLRKPIGRP